MSKQAKMFGKVLIANRGEIAVRISRTLKKMGISSVAVYSDADRNSMHVSLADEAVALGGNTASESYLVADKILQAALLTGAEAIIPGYGFLSENASFAEQCARAGIVFVGPDPEQIRRFGLKHIARQIASEAGVPLTPGTDLIATVDEAVGEANRIGYPLMLKSTAGGGGIGLTRCNNETELVQAFETVKRLGQNFFSDSGVFLERYIDNARHVEVQLFGDGNGQVIALGERDCSLQRRNQKVVEETPAPHLPESTRRKLLEVSEQLGKQVNYKSAGTVEYIYDPARDEFYFLEVNTRLQVEHPVTEMTTGVDLVEWMILAACGCWQKPATPLKPFGASIEVRIYAEDPARDFQPSPGTLTDVCFPDTARVDTWVDTGTEVSAFYDPMIAKLIVHGSDRKDAIQKMTEALASTRLSGIVTNVDYLRKIMQWSIFTEGRVSTQALKDFSYESPAIEVLRPGTYTTLVDYPGRVGYWNIGVPPSGPMDDLAFRIANRLVGNHPSAAGMECTLAGPKLRFHTDAVIALTGASCKAILDNEHIPMWTPVTVRKGQTLDIGKAEKGCRTYLAVRNGMDIPEYLGSRTTFALGQFGGHAGRTIRGADMLFISQPELAACTTPAPVYSPQSLPTELQPEYPGYWQIGVMYGPHGAPDFFTPEAIDMFFDTDWEVHYNSNRLGIRLNGPKPSWARSDGGEAGLHPSNIHDTEYAIGSINFTGDMPVILTQDGPSLGGFVCPVTIVKSELWKVGQLKPGDKIRFFRLSFDEALSREKDMDKLIGTLELSDSSFAKYIPETSHREDSCIPAWLPPMDNRPEVTCRQAGDKYILLEYGPNVLDLKLRLRVHALTMELEKRNVPGIEELSPGVRSLQIRYDSRVLHQKELLQILLDIEDRLQQLARVPSRIIHLPMAFEDSATLDAVARYRQSVRDKAPWLPSNTEFMRRINGLETVEEVKQILFEAHYMVMGLGDVYLGAPCAVPIDPRHRLLTSKYNPARTYTAEGTVGIGGVYMCIYGMDSPGGYQLVGRTLPIWNKFVKNPVFDKDKPWLLRFFDQVKYYEVSEDELTKLREDFREGRLQITIEDVYFDLDEHDSFLKENAKDIQVFRKRQQAAFEAEVALWQNDVTDGSFEPEKKINEIPVEPDGNAVLAEISGNIWKILVRPGQEVRENDPLVIIEAMKSEFSIVAEHAGIVSAVYCEVSRTVNAGDILLSISET